MRGKQTTTLVVLALGLFAFIWLFERHTPDSVQVAERALKLLPGFEPNTVRSVELTSSNLALHAVRNGNQWTLTAPVNYPARADTIDTFLALAGELSTRQRVPAKSLAPARLAGFGLRPPQAVLRFEQPTNRLEFSLGARSPLGDRLYFQLAGHADVFIAGSNFFSRLPRSADDWRDPALLHLDNIPFDRLEIRAAGRGLSLERPAAGQPWRLTRPFAARVDNAKVQFLLQQLRAWRASAFVTDQPAADLEPLGLRTPELELVFGLGTNDLQVVQFGRSPTNDAGQIYARRLAHTNVVLVPAGPLDRLRAPFADWRERRLAHFEVASVDNLEIRGEDALALRRDTNGWRVVEPLNFAADGAIVTNLLLSLGTLEATEFVKDVVTDFGAYGLAKPVRRYILKSTATNAAGTATNLTLVSLDFGTNAAGAVFARRTDEESVYSVPAGNIIRLPQALFQVRNRRLWDFASSNVVNVTIKQGGRTRRLVRDAAREWQNAPGSTGDVNSLAVESTLASLGDLRAVAWTARGADKKPAYGFSPAGHEIALEVAVGEKLQTFTLEFGGISVMRRPYAAVPIEGEAVIFEFPPELYTEVWRDLTIAPALAK